ncbi:MAG: FTR1 family protein [Cyanobacteria bacterium J06638_20]
MNVAAALPTFVVTLREGVEAALVVGIVLAYLKQAERPQLTRWVYGGIAAGMVASGLVGVLLSGSLVWLSTLSDGYGRVAKLTLEGVFGMMAIALLSWMLVWMSRQARAMKGEVEGAVTSVLQQDNAAIGIFSLIAIAVLREGFETVLFLAAQFQEGWIPIVGAVAGIVGAVIIGVLLFQLGVKINLRRFFLVMGVFLLLIVAGLVVSALRHFDGAIATLAQLDPQYAGFCPGTSGACLLGPQVWDASTVLPDKQFPGIILKALFGYTQRLYLGQAIAYLVFLGSVGTLYFRSLNLAAGKTTKSDPAPEQPSAT